MSDSLASEHLEIHLNDFHLNSLRKKIKNYGGLFVGEHSAEVFGDYGAGPNHVLPTGGTSRFSFFFLFVDIYYFTQIYWRSFCIHFLKDSNILRGYLHLFYANSL